MTPTLLALSILAAAAVPPPASGSVPAPPPAAAPPVDPGIVEMNASLDRLMAPLKGQPVDAALARFGPNESTRAASDGRVLFWRTRTQGGTVCGMDPGGAFSCRPGQSQDCLLVVAVDLNSLIKAWKLSGGVDACKLFLAPAPAQPPAA